MTGRIFDIKEMSVHDGPGIRTTVFFKGCPLRCKWCHNPEGITAETQLFYKNNSCVKCDKCNTACSHDECKQFGKCIYVCPNNCLEIVGRSVDADALADELKQNASVLGDSFGGFTFSGGEPLAQPEFLKELCKQLKCYNLCIETSGFSSEVVFKEIVNLLDFVIMDIKLFDNLLHKKYTGVSNEIILKNFEYLKNSGKPYIIRTPLIPNITDSEDNLTAIENFIGNSTWEKIPYNAAAEYKYKMLDLEYEIEEAKR